MKGTSSSGTFVTALVVAVCLLVPFAAPAEPAGEESGTAAAEREVAGYRMGDGEVVFTFDPALFEFGSRGDTGARVALSDFAPDDDTVVAVAGEFNGWSTAAWAMERTDAGTYELRRPLAELTGQGSWAFKFVIDGSLWVEPPASASNAVPTGLGNDSFNLILVLSEPDPDKHPETGREPVPSEGREPEGGMKLPEIVLVDSPLLERLTPPEPQLEDLCALKPVESAMGAPIPVSSNPMITADRRVIGFVSVFVMPPTPEEEAEWEEEASAADPSSFMKRMEELMAERTASVTAAYVAIYESAAGGAETGVFALEFAEPLSAERREALAVEGPGGAVLVGELAAVAVWTDDRNASCLEAVRAHVESVLGK